MRSSDVNFPALFCADSQALPQKMATATSAHTFLVTGVLSAGRAGDRPSRAFPVRPRLRSSHAVSAATARDSAAIEGPLHAGRGCLMRVRDFPKRLALPVQTRHRRLTLAR